MHLMDDLTPSQLQVLRAVERLSQTPTSMRSVEGIAQEAALPFGEVEQALAVLRHGGFVRLEAAPGRGPGSSLSRRRR